MNTETAIQYLSKDPLLHMDMLESICRGNEELLYTCEEGVLLINTACHAVMMSTESKDIANQMLSAITEAPMFVAHQSFYVDDINRKFTFQERMTCHQAVYLSKDPLPLIHTNVVIRQLNEQNLTFIMRHYSHADDEKYQKERLLSGMMYGAFIEGKLAGFIGMHAEGSIGMLEVIPEYQRIGIASELEAFLVNRLLAMGFTPFAQIIVGNTASLKLHRKLHFSISDKTLCWLM